ncbi:armadillo-type protein [Cunninghamella echinulata]|nr:armadillo-type protein [Cunninghamella echinulata]
MQDHDNHITFLLPRPIWVNDIDVSHCTSCKSSFGQLRRRHHCRHCGNIYCHDCSSKNIPLPQFGYGNKPVRVCKDCFEVAYLVTYAIDEDHGLSTQIHGARGLLEMTEKDEEKNLHNMVAHGGIDALIWLCRTSTSLEIHHLITTNLAMLAEKESIRPVIITKWALPPLLQLLRYYTKYQKSQSGLNNDQKNSSTDSINSTGNDIQSNSSSSSLKRSTTATSVSLNQATLEDTNEYTTQLEIIINCTHVIYQLARAGILTKEDIINDGILDILLSLTLYRAHPQLVENNNTTVESDSASKSKSEDDVNIDEIQTQWKEREAIIQSVAAKSISFISSTVANQPTIIEQLQDASTLAEALQSPNHEVKKYIAKTIAYLSLRNDKYKPILLSKERAKALISIIVQLPIKDEEDMTEEERKCDLRHYLNNSDSTNEMNIPNIDIENGLYISSVSHACCALANFATNNTSQSILMSHPNLLQYICNVPAVYLGHIEIHRHVARCLANLALYETNSAYMTHQQPDKENGVNKDIKAFNVIPTLLAMGQSANVTSDIQRHVIRALDNICSNGSKSTRKSTFEFISPFIEQIILTTKDNETLKRAKSLLEKNQTFISIENKTGQKLEDKSITNNHNHNHNHTYNNEDNTTINNNHSKNNNSVDNQEVEEVEEDNDDSTEAENQQIQENGSKGKSKKKNKKKKHN